MPSRTSAFIADQHRARHEIFCNETLTPPRRTPVTGILGRGGGALICAASTSHRELCNLHYKIQKRHTVHRTHSFRPGAVPLRSLSFSHERVWSATSRVVVAHSGRRAESVQQSGPGGAAQDAGLQVSRHALVHVAHLLLQGSHAQPHLQLLSLPQTFLQAVSLPGASILDGLGVTYKHIISLASGLIRLTSSAPQAEHQEATLRRSLRPADAQAPRTPPQGALPFCPRGRAPSRAPGGPAPKQPPATRQPFLVAARTSSRNWGSRGTSDKSLCTRPATRPRLIREDPQHSATHLSLAETCRDPPCY